MRWVILISLALIACFPLYPVPDSGAQTFSGCVMPPHPDFVRNFPNIAEQMTRLSESSVFQSGIDEPEPFNWQSFTGTLDGQLAVGVVRPWKLLVILVDFPDRPHTYPATFFDSLVFSTGAAPAGQAATVREYYSRVSHNRIDVVRLDSLWWVTAPQLATYYLAGGSYGLGTYPNNYQRLVEDVLPLVDPYVNFADYDNDGNGYVDGLCVLHQGPGAEQAGGANFWSHKWGIAHVGYDGVVVSSYFSAPEYWLSGGAPVNMTIGVFAHEMGHQLGLPDLYRGNTGSATLGVWCLMANGSWNGGLGSDPAMPSAWCRTRMGWTTVVDLAGTGRKWARGAYFSDTVYRYMVSPSTAYWLIEHRTETSLPVRGGGLLVYLVDEKKNGSGQAWWPGQDPANHPRVYLVEPDGNYDLQHNTNLGNSGDVFPSSRLPVFGKDTNPWTRWYDGALTGLKLWDIGRVPGIVAFDYCTCDRIGDMDSDGSVDTTDIRILTQAAWENWPSVWDTACAYQRGDVNGDGIIDVIDISWLINVVRRHRTLTFVNPCGE